uniref:Expressed protein n=1 Tax=Oryza sativa subsp. japonica TaxID=39947 RepID=Q2QQ40_ORYSJ|nr:expressed protein [Oryza sativa Japonica Group]
MSIKNASSISFEDIEKSISNWKIPKVNIKEIYHVDNSDEPSISDFDINVIELDVGFVIAIEEDEFEIDKELLRREIRLPKNRTKTKRYLEEVDESFRMKIREVWHNEMREQRRNIFFFDWYENSQIIHFEEFFRTQKKGKEDIIGKNCFPESTYEKSIENKFLGYLVEQQKTQDLSPEQQDSKTIPMEPIILRSHEEPSSHSQFEESRPQSETYLLPYSYPITTIIIPTATPKDKVVKFFDTNDQMSNSLTKIQASSYNKLMLQKEVSSLNNKIDSLVNRNFESYITRIIDTSFYNIINDPKGITRSKFRLFHNVLFSKIYIQPNPNKTLCYHSQTENSFKRKSQNQISAKALCASNKILVHKQDLFGSIFVISDINQFGTINPEEERTKRKLKINDLFQEQNYTKKELRDLKGKIRSLELQNNSCMGQDEEVVNPINSYVKQKWYAEVRYKLNDGFQFSYKTLIDSGADVNCIREDLAKDRKILTERLKKKPPAWTANHTQAVKKIKGNIIPRTPTVQEKYGNNSSYILNIEEVILPLEFGDSDLNIIKIMGKYFPQHQYFIPEYPGKDQNYYETILCETRSAQIFHTRNGDELGFTKLLIQKIISIDDWDKSSNPYVARTIYSTSCANKRYNYWDYQKAWERVLLVQNSQMKHSWFIRFKEGCEEIPLWFFSNWWLKAGAIPEILPQEIIKVITQESKKDLKEYPFILMQFCAETGMPWILKWDLNIQRMEFPATLKRNYYARWWDKFAITPIIEGRKFRAKNKKSHVAQLKEDITRELLKARPELTKGELQLQVYETMFKRLEESPKSSSTCRSLDEDLVQCSQIKPSSPIPPYYSIKQDNDLDEGISDFNPTHI